MVACAEPLNRRGGIVRPIEPDNRQLPLRCAIARSRDNERGGIRRDAGADEFGIALAMGLEYAGEDLFNLPTWAPVEQGLPRAE